MTARRSAAGALALVAGLTASVPDASAPVERPWGYRGHEMAAEAAVSILPPDIPAFFRDAGAQLAWLGPEPDRWRDRSLEAMDQAWAYDHYIDFENVPEGALDAADRFAFLRMLYAAGVARPERDVGFLPYRIVELYERLASSWRRWAAAPPGSPERRWLEERIVSDAGLLGHYVTDGSQPHHTTIHFNGWAAGTPNPDGYTTARDFHGRFERFWVDAHVETADILARLPDRAPALAPSDRSGAGTLAVVTRYLHSTFATVPTLYRLERDVGFDPESPARPAAKNFTVERLAAGSEMLATLWLAAWMDGAG